MEDVKEPAYTTIDEYIALQPEAVRERLQRLRAVIREEAPDASEKISWGMPTFFLHGNLIHFALASRHIGLYPGASGIEHFQEAFVEAGLKFSKGALQMPLAQPLPEALVRAIVRFRAAENRLEAETRAQLKKRKKQD